MFEVNAVASQHPTEPQPRSVAPNSLLQSDSVSRNRKRSKGRATVTTPPNVSESRNS